MRIPYLLRPLVVVPVIVATLLVPLVAQSTAPTDPPEIPETLALQLTLAATQQRLALVEANLAVCSGQLAPTTYRAAVEPLAADAKARIETFEAHHPGWTIDPATLRVTPRSTPTP